MCGASDRIEKKRVCVCVWGWVVVAAQFSQVKHLFYAGGFHPRANEPLVTQWSIGTGSRLRFFTLCFVLFSLQQSWIISVVLWSCKLFWDQARIVTKSTLKLKIFIARFKGKDLAFFPTILSQQKAVDALWTIHCKADWTFWSGISRNQEIFTDIQSIRIPLTQKNCPKCLTKFRLSRKIVQGEMIHSMECSVHWLLTNHFWFQIFKSMETRV